MLTMLAPVPRVDGFGMRQVPGTRVRVDVSPRLLADAVTRVLTDHGLEVIVEPGADGVVDVIVTSHEVDSSESGAVVSVRPGDARDVATAAAGAAEQGLGVTNLDQLVAAVRAFVAVAVVLYPRAG